MKHPLFVSFAMTLFLARLTAGETGLSVWNYSETPGAAGEKVTIPHSWNATDIQSGKGKNPSSLDGYRRAPSWYTTALAADTLPAGKRVFARFEGVSSVATVSLNGETLGEHRGPGTAFAYELTKGLKRDGTDALVVKADNTWREDVAPISGDFGIPGGIYRPAKLLVKDTVCFSPLSSGDFGAQVRQLKATREAGELAVSAHLDNAGAPAETEITFAIKDASGKTVATKSVKKSLAAGASEVAETIAVSNPTLWHGVKNPYLYTLELSLKSGDGSADTVSLPVGFRSYRIDPKLGFILNGESYPLRGVNRHQDRENQAWAITAAQEREDVAIIREIGANTVRAAHYPHSQTFLDECDRLGLLVWAEAPMIDTVGAAPEAFGDNVTAQFREMIRQQSHHASVFVWSIFNEVGMRKGNDPVAVLRRLNELAHQEDATRPTAAATNHKHKIWNNITDVMAYNSYPGWYGGGTGDQSEAFAAYRATAPDKAWAISEYGAGASLSHQDDTVVTPVNPKGKWHPEAWQCRIHENALASINRHPELWGTYVWNMFDFASAWRTEGERDGINDKGLVTYDRKTRKDAFYLYRANWSKSPVLHLLARRDDKRKAADTVIRYYTNLKEVTVKLNGAELPEGRPYAPSGYIIPGVKLRPGLNTVTATAKDAEGKPVSDSLEWTLAAK